MTNQVGTIPEFTSDAPEGAEAEGTGEEQVKQAEAEEAPETETETPTEPAAEEQPGGDPDDSGTFTKAEVENMLVKATEGLRNEIVDLRKKVNSSTGTDRQIAKQELVVAQQQLEDLSDVHPDDIAIVEKIVKKLGYVRQEDISRTSYESVKHEQLNAFLEKYPEYKPENDPGDANWSKLQQELQSGFYTLPKDPKLIGKLLEKVHRDIAKAAVDAGEPVKKRQVQIASQGAGGTQRSSSSKSLDPQTRAMFERGGWSKEEIDKMEKKLK